MALEAASWPEIDIVEIGDVKIEPVADMGILSVAIPQNGRSKLDKILKKKYGLRSPQIGKSEKSKDMNAFGLQEDQFFLTFPYQDAWQASLHEKSIGDAGYTTDQSDAWVIFRLSGGGVRAALARICKIDLHEEVFAISDVTRTSMEHMGAILFRENQDQFLIFAAASSRHDFAHALAQSARNIAYSSAE